MQQESILNGRYRLGQTVGEGGMAVVYLARDLLLNREVAVKVLRDQYASDDTFLERFRREGQIAAGMTHPNIVSVYDVGNDQDLHYIVMEHIRGPNLKELIYQQGPFSVDGAVFIISQVASALDYAHQRGLVHRDIKPQNILVDREGNAKVVDFGIAKGMRDPGLTETGTGMGTVHYVSPEQARGLEIGPASDLYSTGVVLYEMLTKKLPFDGESAVAIAMKHVSDPPPRPSDQNPNVPPEIDRIILKALAKDPAERFPSGAAFETALRFWQDPPPVRQRPPAQRPANRPVCSTTGRSDRDRRRGGRPPRGPGTGVPPPRQRKPQPSNELGCATWFIGVLLLTVIVGIVLALLQWGPGLIEANPSRPDPTPTEVTATEPEAIASTATEDIEPTTEASPTEPAATPTPEPTATDTPTSGPVPELRNLRVSEARSAVAGRWSLNQQEEFHPTVEPGLIIRQDPPPDTMLEFESEVTIWVSKGPAIVQIPDVAGTPRDQAIEVLDDAGFVVEVSEEPSETIDEGDAIRTEPEIEAELGDTVTLFVSLGDVVVLPDLFGVDVFEARDTLVDAGLTVRNVIPRTCDLLQRLNPTFDCEAVEPNSVVAISSGSVSLDWGDIVERGTEVDLVYLQELASP
ncbi:Stk1 family PASTA domain-containing Ser/Thr kinase [soil metagenome]